jgi:hypothetical protein
MTISNTKAVTGKHQKTKQRDQPIPTKREKLLMSKQSQDL